MREGRAPGLVPLARETQDANEGPLETPSQGRLYSAPLLPFHSRCQIPLEPSAEFIQVRKREGLHLQAGQVVEPSRAVGSEWDLQLIGEDGRRLLQGSGREDLSISQLHQVGSSQRVEANGCPPLVASLLGVQEALTPEFGDDPDPDWKSPLHGAPDSLAREDRPEGEAGVSLLCAHLDRQGRILTRLCNGCIPWSGRGPPQGKKPGRQKEGDQGVHGDQNRWDNRTKKFRPRSF